MEIFIDKSEVKHIRPLNSLKSAEKLAKKVSCGEAACCLCVYPCISGEFM